MARICRPSRAQASGNVLARTLPRACAIGSQARGHPAERDPLRGLCGAALTRCFCPGGPLPLCQKRPRLHYYPVQAQGSVARSAPVLSWWLFIPSSPRRSRTERSRCRLACSVVFPGEVLVTSHSADGRQRACSAGARSRLRKQAQLFAEAPVRPAPGRGPTFSPATGALYQDFSPCCAGTRAQRLPVCGCAVGGRLHRRSRPSRGPLEAGVVQPVTALGAMSASLGGDLGELRRLRTVAGARSR